MNSGVKLHKLHGSTLLTAHAVARDLCNGRARPGLLPLRGSAGGSGVVQPPALRRILTANVSLSERRLAVSSPSMPIVEMIAPIPPFVKAVFQAKLSNPGSLPVVFMTLAHKTAAGQYTLVEIFHCGSGSFPLHYIV